MRKLLSANFSRLWKSKLFPLALLTAAVMSGLILFVNQFNSASSIKYMDFPFFSQFIYNPVILAAFITLFLGTEYSDGILRNKLSIGHSRGSVYAANLCASVILSVSFVVIQVLVCLGIGSLVFETFRMPTEYVAVAAIILLVSMIAGVLYAPKMVYAYDFDRYTRWPFTSAVVLVVSTVLGYYSFSKKDIK